MIEEYGTLSEEELLNEINQEIEEEGGINISRLEMTFENGKLLIQGELANEEELVNLVGVMENHVDPEDYSMDIELDEGDSALAKVKFTKQEESPKEEGAYVEETLDNIQDDEMDFVDEEDLDDDKW